MRGLTGLADETGGALVLVAVALTAVLGAAALAVDAGTGWLVRRRLATGTDAAALAAASEFARGGDGCSSGVIDVLAVNAPGATATCVRSVTGPDTGYVTVGATSAPVDPAFAEGSIDVEASSSARWGGVARVTRLRPIAVCADEPHLLAWFGLGPDPGGDPSPGVHRLWPRASGDDADEACGDTGLGWTYIDPDGGAPDTNELRRRLQNGYSRTIAVGDCDADGVPGDGCPGTDPGGEGELNLPLDELVASGRTFAVAITDGPGWNISGFVGMVLYGYRAVGLPETRYIDVRFSEVIVESGCCAPGSGLSAAYAVRLCAGDHDPVDLAVRCA